MIVRAKCWVIFKLRLNSSGKSYTGCEAFPSSNKITGACLPICENGAPATAKSGVLLETNDTP